MSRSLTILFRRDPSRDRQQETVQFEGYQLCWPDGRPVCVGLDAFCKHGQRLLGLGKHLDVREKLIKLVYFPLSCREADLNRIPGHRVRRLFMQREGNIGRLHFMDGTPTTITFIDGSDDARVCRFFGVTEMADGEQQWFDLAAIAVEKHYPHAPHGVAAAHPRLLALEAC